MGKSTLQVITRILYLPSKVFLYSATNIPQLLGAIHYYSFIVSTTVSLAQVYEHHLFQVPSEVSYLTTYGYPACSPISASVFLFSLQSGSLALGSYLGEVNQC